MATLFQKREALRVFYSQGIKPADDRRPISEEIAQDMVQQLVDLGVSKDAPIAVFDTFLTLCLTLQEHGFTNLTLIERHNARLTTSQQKYYDNIKGICDKVRINYYVPRANNLANCTMKFSVVIGNPPYQAGTKSSGNTIWDKFVAQSLELLEDDGYLMFINPPRWRQPNDRLSYVYQKYQLISLKINDAKVGKKVFKASTPFDVYTIQKTAPYKKSYIEFSDGVSGTYDASKFPFIPNSMIDFWTQAFASNDEKLKVYQSYSHEARLKHMSKVETESHVHPIIEKLNAQGITYLYSSKVHEHQNTPKTIFRDQGKSMATVNESGGCGRHIYYVLDTSPAMVDFLNGDRFTKIKESVLFSQRYLSDKPLNFIPLSAIQ